jgi:DNA-binding response OmpR family regulator
MGQSILVIEDEQNLVAALKVTLEREGYQVLFSYDGIEGLGKARSEKPDLVILDVMLPSLDGLEVCRMIRRESNTPILFLTAKGEEIDRVVGLEIGGDDYVTKPFSMRELVARVRGILRRSDVTSSSESDSPQTRHLIAGRLEIHLDSHSATLDGNILHLRPKEFDLLAFLVSNKGIAFTRDQLLEKVWGYDYMGETRTVDVHIRWLREKLQSDTIYPPRITTIRGVGYRLD